MDEAGNSSKIRTLLFNFILLQMVAEHEKILSFVFCIKCIDSEEEQTWI